ncbi:hypothetical protein NDU88_006492 [Pleurodeles waltl]|uniref:Uncharacterized protein n=1 Tax=Pleurodeles waltl TaxID=8319 RepID=A0AAV7LP98_PLEWA|nr:hypothetical protein NDU88_006492 [Pleurodeles waltl]
MRSVCATSAYRDLCRDPSMQAERAEVSPIEISTKIRPCKQSGLMRSVGVSSAYRDLCKELSVRAAPKEIYPYRGLCRDLSVQAERAEICLND